MAVRARAGIVLFGDVVASRALPRATTWLRALRSQLDDAYGTARLAPFEFTQGDELQGLLVPHADPFEAVLRAGLDPDRLAMRWVIAMGGIDAGRGPATQRTGEAFLRARELSDLVRRRRAALLARTGDAATDALLDDVAPVLGRLLAELTARQRVIARLLLIDGLSQADAARRLGIRAPTVSVAAERARVREIAALRDACLRLFRAAIPGSKAA